MSEPPDTPALFVVGANHRSSSAMLRDLMFVDDRAVPAFLRRLEAGGIGQAVVLSTCDRVEIQGAHGDPRAVADVIANALAEHAELPQDEIAAGLYTLTGADAVRHIFAVASSLDSQVVGEPQVLGQVKAGHRLARDNGMTGPELEAALQAAYGTAKRVRAETAIAEGPVSMAAAAVQVARDVHGDLSRCAALLAGDGDMGELLAQQLLSAGLSQLTVTAPSSARAQAAAGRLDCHVIAFEDLAPSLADAEIVLAAVGGRQYVITAAMIESALKRRRQRPMYLVDAAVPGDVEPAVDRIDDAFVYDLDDLERLAMLARAGREQAAADAWKIVGAEVEAFERARGGRRAVPAIVALRDHFEAARREVLEDQGGAEAEEVTRRLVNRLLHAPSLALRQLAAEDRTGGERTLAEQVLRQLFGLGRAAGDETGQEPEQETE